MKNNQFTTKEDVYEIIIIFSFCGVGIKTILFK